jgi:EF hand
VLVNRTLLRCNSVSLTLQVTLSILMKHRKSHFIPNFELRSVVLMSALVLGGVSAAQAQSTAPPMAAGPQANATAKELDAAFAKADTNKDGKLDKKEAQTMPSVADRFEQLDVNGDGFISREEFNKAAGS